MALSEQTCIDCGFDIRNLDDLTFEYFMVHNDVWAETGLKGNDGLLCIGCVENRIGRALVPGDFTDAPVNDPGRMFFLPPSARMLDRLGVA